MDRPRKFLFVALQPGVRPSHMGAFCFAAFVTILLAVLINVLQPYLLEVFLRIPRAAQGSVTGSTTVVGEVVLMTMMGVWGASSDRLGRRAVYVLGVGVVGLGFALHPLAQGVYSLWLVRAVYALGMAAATGMLATLIGDYVVDRDRGKANGMMGVCNACGAAIAATLLVKIPTKLRESYAAEGMAPLEAGQKAGWQMYLLVGLFCLLCAAILAKSLGGKETQHGHSEEGIPFRTRMGEGVAAARRRPGVALAYVTAFVARADLALAGLFFPLWGARYLQDHPDAVLSLGKYQCTEKNLAALGGDAAQLCRTVEGAACELGSAGCVLVSDQLDALRCMASESCLTLDGLAEGGLVIGLIGVGGLVFSPVIGLLCDRIHRVSAVALSLFINVLAYGSTYFVDKPLLGLPVVLSGLAIGAGEVAGVISTQALIQEQAPEATRGSVIGTFGFFGGLGILVNSLVGGELFDAWMFQGPFLWLSALNLVVVLVCLAARGRVEKPRLVSRSEAPAAASAHPNAP